MKDRLKDKTSKSFKSGNTFLRDVFRRDRFRDKTSEEFLGENSVVIDKGNNANRSWLVILIVIFIGLFIYENRDHFHKSVQDTSIQQDRLPSTQQQETPKVDPPVIVKLYQATSRGDINTVREYITQLSPGEINSVIGGMTPVMKASSVGNADLVRLLIEHGADPNKRGSHQRTALQYAAEKNRLAAAKVLVNFGADLNGTDTARLSPLTMAADRGYRDFALFLIDKGADVNIQHVQGWTALIDAARTGDLLLVKRLVEAGADINLRLKNGGNALDIARKNNHNDVEAYLLKQYEK